MPTGDATPRMMVLGLVVRQPDTVSGVARRLADEFASAQFPKSSAYTNIPALQREGYLRLVEHGPESSLDRYEATSAGIEHLRGWVQRSNPSPALRDALQGKLDFLELEDLGALIQEVREQERTHRAACEAAHARLLQEQETRRRIRARGKSIDWRIQLRGIQTQDELTLWGTMIQRLEQLRESLEQLHREIAADQARAADIQTRAAAGGVGGGVQALASSGGAPARDAAGIADIETGGTNGNDQPDGATIATVGRV
jgi:DNA-binding PadR family transcriptional regulator